MKYSEKEVLYMTPRKFAIMMKAYHEYHGTPTGMQGGGNIDDLP